MRNFSQGQSTDTQSLILESSEGIASSSLRSTGRGAFHTTSFHLVVKDSLSEWKQLELKHNTLKITELEYFYDINESRIRGGYGESSDISKICQKIKKRTRVHGWKSIKGFNLEISGNNMFPNSKIRELSEGLSRSMIKPQHFTLDYRSSLIEEKELNNLSKAIGRYLASLNALKLQFRYDGRREVLGITKPIDQNYECKNVTDITLQGLGRNLRRYLNNLTVLDLKFANCTQISDKGLLQIGSTIHTSRFNLIQLSLDFSRCSQITDEGVEKFLSHISKNSKKLKHLDLNFSNCTSIGIKSLKEDSLDLEHDLNSLEELELNFESCVMMRDEYVQFLASQFLPKFTHLKELKLSLDGCESITDESVKALLSVNYNQLFDLQKLTLNL